MLDKSLSSRSHAHLQAREPWKAPGPKARAPCNTGSLGGNAHSENLGVKWLEIYVQSFVLKPFPCYYGHSTEPGDQDERCPVQRPGTRAARLVRVRHTGEGGGLSKASWLEQRILSRIQESEPSEAGGMERTGVSRTQGDRHLTKCQLDRAQRSGRCSEEWQVPACSDLMRQATNRWQNWMYIYRRVRTTVLERPYLAHPRACSFLERE